MGFAPWINQSIIASHLLKPRAQDYYYKDGSAKVSNPQFISHKTTLRRSVIASILTISVRPAGYFLHGDRDVSAGPKQHGDSPPRYCDTTITAKSWAQVRGHSYVLKRCLHLYEGRKMKVRANFPPWSASRV